MPLDNTQEVPPAIRPSNQHYRADMKQTVRYPRLFLGLLGVWPMLSRDSSPAKKYIFALRIVVSCILLLFVIIPPLLHIILREKDTKLRFLMLAPIWLHVTNLLKYGFLVLRSKTISLCMDHVETDWKSIVSERDRAIIKSNASGGRRLTLIACIFTGSTGISYHAIMPIASGKTINEINETVKPLAYPGYDILFDTQMQPTYEIIFFTICVSAFISCNIISASCSFTAVFVSHACGLLQIVESRLKTLLHSVENKNNNDLVKQRQSFIAQYHNNVLRLSSRIEEVLQEICFLEVISSTMIICFVEYYLVNVKKNRRTVYLTVDDPEDIYMSMLCFIQHPAKNDIFMVVTVVISDKKIHIDSLTLERHTWGRNETVGLVTYGLALITNIFNILMFCYIGELLKDQGRRVGEAAYMIEWYKLPCKSSHDLIMILIMSNNCPPKITAGGIFELSIRSFGSILKMSITYCNMLRTLTT